MTITKRALLAAAGTAAGSTLLSHAAGAQSFPFAPNQRCPDPAVQILDPGLAKYRIGASLPVTALADAFYSEVE